MAHLGYSSGITGTNITTIGEVNAVGFSLSADTADTTSTLSAYASGVPTTIKANTIFISLSFDGSNGGEAENFVNEFNQKRVSTWTITFPTGTFSAAGFVSTVTVASQNQSEIMMDITISLTGQPSFN